MAIQMNPYLNFNGTAEEAFNFYKSVFGGEFSAVMRFSDMAGCDEMPLSDTDKSKIANLPRQRTKIQIGPLLKIEQACAVQPTHKLLRSEWFFTECAKICLEFV